MLPASQAELQQIQADCHALVRRKARLSAGAALVPLPGVDMLADVLVFSDLLEDISRRFGLSQTDLGQLSPGTRQYALLAASRVGSDWIGRLINKQLAKLVLKKMGTRLLGKSVLRFIPLAGQAAAATLSYRAVVHLGDKHVKDCHHVALALLAQPK